MNIPHQCIGNVINSVAGNWLDNETIDCSSLANKIRQLVKVVNDDVVRKFYNSDALADELSKGSEDFINNTSKKCLVSVVYVALGFINIFLQQKLAIFLYVFCHLYGQPT